MHETCDSYVVVEYNGDIYPCDFFVHPGWRLGNISSDPLRAMVESDRWAGFIDTARGHDA